MSTSNPFEKLSIKREDDDEEENFKEVKTKSSNVPYGIEAKKKKSVHKSKNQTITKVLKKFQKLAKFVKTKKKKKKIKTTNIKNVKE